VFFREKSAFFQELVAFADPSLLQRPISTSSQGPELKCGLNKWKRISSRGHTEDPDDVSGYESLARRVRC
jgi:hypothetical protein